MTSRNYLLLTPGPLTTTRTVKEAMLFDSCTWDDDYNLGVVQTIRQQLVQLATPADGYTAVLLQGSGSYAVEAVLGSVIGEQGKVLIVSNGAYGARMIEMAQLMGIACHPYDCGEVSRPDAAAIEQILQNDPAITHIAMVHSETTTGMLNPIEEVAELADFSISPEQWGNFLCTLFDEWVKEDVGKYYVQIFDSTLANWMGEQPGICTMAKTCGHAGVMEFNGDVYACDHFVFPEYKLGNIYQKTLVEMMYSERQQAFGQMKQKSLPTQCRECEWLFACNGECPKNRFAHTADGEPGLNYLCAGYRKFFKHVAPYMDFMKQELMNQRPPANIMDAIREGRFN